MITTGMTMRMATSMAEGAHLPLAIWLSPAFPVGAFAYSHALEWAVESGAVEDAATLSTWIDDLLRCGSGRNDAILLAASHRAANDAAALIEINELALALAPSRERHLETSAQGAAFVIAMRAAWPCAALDALDGETAYPVALGAAAAGHHVPLAATLEHFLLAFTANLVSAAVRLGPIGQTDGQRLSLRQTMLAFEYKCSYGLLRWPREPEMLNATDLMGDPINSCAWFNFVERNALMPLLQHHAQFQTGKV